MSGRQQGVPNAIVQASPKPGTAYIDVVSGVEGPCLSLGDHRSGNRIAGPKPWCGGEIVHRFVVNVADLKETIAQYEETQ